MTELSTEDRAILVNAANRVVPDPASPADIDRMTDEELLSMDWFVEGVEGEIPS